MTTKIPRSSIPVGTNFSKTVSDHLEALEHWRQQMANVAKDPSTYSPFPAPVAPHMVEQALRKEQDEHGVVTYVSDYEIVDDGPTPEQTLQAKKNNLVGMVSHMEQSASAQAFPLARRRWTEFMVSDASSKKPEDRSKEEIDLLARNAATGELLTKIHRHGAMLHNEIEDLTAETVESWRPAEFPK